MKLWRGKWCVTGEKCPCERADICSHFACEQVMWSCVWGPHAAACFRQHVTHTRLKMLPLGHNAQSKYCRVEETTVRQSGAPWKQLSWHAYTHTHAHTHTHKEFGQSVVIGLTPQTLVLQTHPLPVLVRKDGEQQWRGRDGRHSRVKQRHHYSTAWTQTCGYYVCLTPADTIIKSKKNNILKRNLSFNKHGKGITSTECVLRLGLCVFSVWQ